MLQLLVATANSVRLQGWRYTSPIREYIPPQTMVEAKVSCHHVRN